MINAIVSSYEVVELLGHGGTSVVYLAKEIGNENGESSVKVALKLKSKEMRVHDVRENPFKYEYDILVAMHRVNSAHFVRPLACGTDETRHFMIMELMDATLDQWGENLRVELADGLAARTFATVVSRLRASVEAIGTAHALGYVIRDVSSRNFLIRGEETKATDLSSAILMGPSAIYHDTRVTARYSSHNSAKGCLARYEDDYEALCYVWIDVLTDRLPWRKCKRPSVIRQIKIACLQASDEHYAHLPRVLRAMLPLEAVKSEKRSEKRSENEFHQERRKMLLNLIDELEMDQLSSFISEFKDTSECFSQFHGLF